MRFDGHKGTLLPNLDALQDFSYLLTACFSVVTGREGKKSSKVSVMDYICQTGLRFWQGDFRLEGN